MTERHGTGIEWTHRPGTKGVTWNPIRAVNKETGGRGHFCVHVTEGCRNCYAERLQPRFKNPIRFAAQDYEKVRLEMPENLLMQPHKWRAPRTIFPFSMTDLFLEHHPLKWIDAVFDVMARATRHTFIVLTKRGRVMHYYMNDRYRRRPPPANVWLVVSIHDQPSAEAAVPLILQTPAAVRGVSAEPLLGPVDFTKMKNEFDVYFDVLQGYAMITDGRGHQNHVPHGPVLDWIIAGGESGPARDPQKPIRPMHPDWVRAIESQCRHAGTPFFFKQWGEWAPTRTAKAGAKWKETEFPWGPDQPAMARVGKKVAGNLLDGRKHEAWPK